MDPQYKISKSNFLNLLAKLSERASVYVPYQKAAQLSLELFHPARVEAMEFGQIRQSEPVKSFLTIARKELVDSAAGKPVITVGLKACDLASLKVQGFVFAENEPPDPFYVENRKRLTIFSFDCTPARETCFCIAMEGQPYPKKNFDLNFSIVNGGFVAVAGSEAGQAILHEFRDLFTEASAADAEEKDASRKKVYAQVKDFIDRRGTPDTKQVEGTVMKNYASPIWKDFYSTCVECGACNLACPTCHCFLICDEKKGSKATRFAEWDACLYRRFAQVAGGGNPRKHLWERLRNRFEKKLDFFPKVAGVYACTGCGRCIEACPGDIDIREVLKGLVTGKWNNPPND
jgi:formate hydrogenlyase subunit 6/NADH:ubiquinone oxidoreductase subunit I